MPLIPKVDNHSSIKNDKPISIILVQYKMIAKLLANRLASAIDSLISPVQSNFVKRG